VVFAVSVHKHSSIRGSVNPLAVVQDQIIAKRLSLHLLKGSTSVYYPLLRLCFLSVSQEVRYYVRTF
jgi:hypothetical protein